MKRKCALPLHEQYGLSKVVQQLYSPSTRQTLTVSQMEDGSEYPTVDAQLEWSRTHRDAINLLLGESEGAK